MIYRVNYFQLVYDTLNYGAPVCVCVCVCEPVCVCLEGRVSVSHSFLSMCQMTDEFQTSVQQISLNRR